MWKYLWPRIVFFKITETIALCYKISSEVSYCFRYNPSEVFPACRYTFRQHGEAFRIAALRLQEDVLPGVKWSTTLNASYNPGTDLPRINFKNKPHCCELVHICTKSGKKIKRNQIPLKPHKWKPNNLKNICKCLAPTLLPNSLLYGYCCKFNELHNSTIIFCYSSFSKFIFMHCEYCFSSVLLFSLKALHLVGVYLESPASSILKLRYFSGQ